MSKLKFLRGFPLIFPLAAVLAVADCAAQDGPDAGLTLPSGFHATIVADHIGTARHLTVLPNGDVFVAVSAQRGGSGGGVVALRDTTGDGVADVVERFGSGSGDDVQFHDGYLYFSSNDRVVRYQWRPGALRPAGEPEVIVRDLPTTGNHRAKSITFGTGDDLYVDVGSATNACQAQDRQAGVMGTDPCTELATRAGIWRFSATRQGQTQADGEHFATGLRNVVALAFRQQDGHLYGVQHGRDQLNLWDGFDNEASAEKPAEEFVRIERGSDFGWPYCFFDPEAGRLVLAPEYGGDGQQVGRCAEKGQPLIAFPAHWAPDGLLFYRGTQFPEAFRGGAFIAVHGSWNRAPLPQQGYNVVFAPFEGDEPTGKWSIFADGFAGGTKGPGAEHRPVGLAEGPDGSLYVSDDRGGRIYRITFGG
jgi:glucose/arabinose dehydrogenase